MKRGVIVRAEAEAELSTAVLWYEKRREGLGDDLADEVAAALAVIADGFDGSPYFDSVDATPVRRVLLRRFPYAITFVVEADRVEVVAFAHHRRRPGYWRPQSG